jgi:hypothetical protein
MVEGGADGIEIGGVEAGGVEAGKVELDGVEMIGAETIDRCPEALLLTSVGKEINPRRVISSHRRGWVVFLT